MPGWLGRILVALVLTQATFLARPVTSCSASALGADEDRRIGLITASFAVIPLVVAVPLGRVADRRRLVGMFAAGVAILTAFFLLLGLAGSLAELALSGALCSASATWP